MAADKERLEGWIRLENKLARGLLESDSAQRSHKYSEVYEAMYSEFPPKRRAEMNEKYRTAAIAQHAILGKVIGGGKAVLDIGCGFGNLASLPAEDGNQVVGFDINGLHVEECKTAWAHLENARFEKTSGVALAFPDDHFDFAVSTSVFEHIHPDDVARHLAESALLSIALFSAVSVVFNILYIVYAFRFAREHDRNSVSAGNAVPSNSPEEEMGS